jgi:general secretion pathway protein D
MFYRKAGMTLLLTLSLVACSAHSGYYRDGIKATHEKAYDEAVLYFRLALDAKPGDPVYSARLAAVSTRAAQGHLLRGRALRDEGKLIEASSELQLAISLDPSLFVAQSELDEIARLQKIRSMMSEAQEHFQARRLPQAKVAVKKVLDIDSNNPVAQALLKQIIEDRNTLVGGFELAVESKAPITLKFKDAKLQEVFKILNQLSGVNFIFDEDIKAQTVTLLLEDATFSQALELLMKMNNLSSRVLNPKTVIIYDNTTEKQKQYEDQVIQTFYLSNIDAKKAVNLLRTMLQLRKVYVHEELNAIVVRDRPEVVKLVEQMLENADLSDSEVLFDLELIEVNHGDILKLGAKLSTNSISAVAVTGTTQVAQGIPTSGIDGLIKGIGGLDVLFTLPSATFDFTKTLTDTNILATPKIRVKNREKAKVHVGSREPTLTSTISGDNVSSNVQYIDIGVKVDVEPIIQLDGSVMTKLRLEVSSKGEKLTSSDENTVAFAINTTNAETALILLDGERTIIGGLIRSVENKTRNTIPFLGDIPLLGALFSSHDTTDVNREILMSITPHIVKNLNVPSMEKSRIWSGGEDEMKAGANFSAFAEEPDFTEESQAKPSPAPSVQTRKGEASLTPLPPVVQPVDVPEPVTALPLPQVEPVVPSGAPELPVSSTQSQPMPETIVPTEPIEVIAPAETVGTADGVEQVLVPPAEIRTVPEQSRVFFTGPKLVHPGEEFALELQISESKGLFSAPLFVNYDQQLLTYLRFEEGNLLKLPNLPSIFSLSPNPQRGELIIGSKQASGGTGANGSGTLVRLYFQAKDAGTAVVRPNRVNLRAVDGNRLQAETEPFQIEIR